MSDIVIKPGKPTTLAGHRILIHADYYEECDCDSCVIARANREIERLRAEVERLKLCLHNSDHVAALAEARAEKAESEVKLLREQLDTSLYVGGKLAEEVKALAQKEPIIFKSVTDGPSTPVSMTVGDLKITLE